jgi:hypothetical protein
MSDHGFPRFDGKGNAQTWLSTFRFSLADAALLDERFAAPAVQVARLCSHLDGDAALWRDTALAARNGQLWENVDQFAVAFLAAHIAVNDRQSARDELWSCEQGNDKVKDYVVRFNRVIARIPGITRDDEALDRFIHGLSRTGVWRVVRIANPQTLQAAMTEAQLADDRASHSRRDVLDIPNPPHPSAAADRDQGSRAGDAEPMDLGVLASMLAGMGKLAKCFYCRVTGHFWKDCSNLDKVWCQLCGAPQHGAHNCPQYAVQRKSSRH